MKILVINAGSSSVKFSLFEMRPEERILAQGRVERIGLDGTRFCWSPGSGGPPVETPVDVYGTDEAVGVITAAIIEPRAGLVASRDEISGIGHRVVHGGEHASGAVRISPEVKAIIERCIPLAPLHNPPNLAGIDACERYFPGVPQVAVFDTAFHAGIPERACLYALPYRFYRQDRIRRYGFHGISHQYAATEAAEILGRPLTKLKMVTCHLGNGSSIAAVDGGKSIDTSMGLTPLEGPPMGSRCGDIDPAIALHLMKTKGLNVDQVLNLLNRESGMLGLAGIGSGDFRDITAAMEAGNRRAELAIEVYAYRVRKYIGAYAFAMGGIDAVVFTAGIGENSPLVRKKICQGLEAMGIVLDEEKNADPFAARPTIHAAESRVHLLVVSTDEQKAIARETLRFARL